MKNILLAFMLLSTLFTQAAFATGFMDEDVGSRWVRTEKRGEEKVFELFEGNLRIAKVSKKTPGFYWFVFNEKGHALVWAPIAGFKQYLCYLTVLAKLDISEKDRADLVAEGINIEEGFYTEIDIGNYLDIKMSSITVCNNPEKCEYYLKLPIYERQK